jgi:protein-tyrosine phosphatase
LIDSHCHILPNTDDGAETVAMALQMARLAASEGISEIVATPHYAQLERTSPRADVERRVREFQERLDDAGIAVRMLSGSELYLTPESPKLGDNGELVTINGGHYILVETAFHEYPRYVDEVLFQLQARGLRPILAHPERYAVFSADPGQLEPVVQRGIYTQVTAGSLLGHFGKKAKSAAEQMLTRGLCHVVATDAHRAEGARNTEIFGAFRRAVELVGEECARAMVESVPAAIVADQSFELPPVVQQSQSGGWGIIRRLVGARS